MCASVSDFLMHDSLCVYVSTIYSCVVLLLLGSVTNYVYPRLAGLRRSLKAQFSLYRKSRRERHLRWTSKTGDVQEAKTKIWVGKSVGLPHLENYNYDIIFNVQILHGRSPGRHQHNLRSKVAYIDNYVVVIVVFAIIVHIVKTLSAWTQSYPSSSSKRYLSLRSQPFVSIDGLVTY